MMKNKVSNYIIIGAGGFVGKYLSDKIYSSGASLALFGNSIVKEHYPNAVVKNGLLRDFDELNDYIQESTCIYYLVNTISPTLDDHNLALNDLELFVKFLSWLSRYDNVRLVYTSSGGTIYKQGLELPICELQPTEPISYYGMAKLSSENYLKLFSYKYGFSYTIARISNPYGVGQPFKRNQGLIPMILTRIKEGQPVTIYGDGSMVRDYIYITDVAEALYKIAISKNTKNTILNVASGQATSVMDVVNSVETALNYKLVKNYVTEHTSIVKSNVLDIKRAIKSLSWHPRVVFDEGINLLCDSLDAQ